MSASDPSGTRPPALSRLFGFGRKSAPSEVAAPLSSEPVADPKSMRHRLGAFEDTRVADVMVPRADIQAVEVTMLFADLVRFLGDVQHSRVPVFRETLDDLIGFVHIKDVMAEIARGGEPQRHALESLKRDVLYVPPSMKVAALLVKMQTTRIHLAIVVDEYGGTDGLVTLEDLVEVIVGDISDEHDEDEKLFVRRGPRVWDADARTYVDDFTAAAGIDLMLENMQEDIDTLGGVAVALAGKVPARGEMLRHPGGAEIEILEADARRIRRLRVHISDAPSAQTAEDTNT